MEKDIVIALRKKLKMGKNRPLIIRSDENYMIDERTNLVMWDDANSILYSAGANQNRETNVSEPATMIAISYDNIVKMESTYGSEDFKTLLDSFVSDGKTNAESVERMMDMLFNLTDMNTYVAAKDRNPDILKKVDVATGHYSNEKATPYIPPEENTLEVNPVITDMSSLTNLDELYSEKLAAHQAQVKNTLKDPVHPVEPEKTYEDRRTPKTEPTTTEDTGAGAGTVSGGGTDLDDTTSDTGAGTGTVDGGGTDLDDLDDTTSDAGAGTGTVSGDGADLDDLDDTTEGSTTISGTGDGVIDSDEDN